MRIEKTAIQTQPGRFKTVYKTSSYLSNDQKMKIRYKIETETVKDEIYDIYSILGDLCKAQKDVMDQLIANNDIIKTENIDTFIQRQESIEYLCLAQNQK